MYFFPPVPTGEKVTLENSGVTMAQMGCLLHHLGSDDRHSIFGLWNDGSFPGSSSQPCFQHSSCLLWGAYRDSSDQVSERDSEFPPTCFAFPHVNNWHWLACVETQSHLECSCWEWAIRLNNRSLNPNVTLQTQCSNVPPSISVGSTQERKENSISRLCN